MLSDSSHRVRTGISSFLFFEKSISNQIQCVMITGDDPLTAIHVAHDVEIMTREALILDLKGNSSYKSGSPVGYM